LYFGENSDISMEIDKLEVLDVAVSVFIGPHLGMNIIGNKLYIAKSLSFQAARIETTPVPGMLIECLKACSDETRLKILKVFWHGHATTQGLSQILGLSPSTISLHLKQMKSAGLVDSYKVNKYVYYFIKPGIIKETIQLLQNYFDS
ncbi:MAG: metalloregulator ArsR/SmtB family transcription factor, partial [Eubacteriales bacterium]|nr:metalloregulator ArsR/SmtB family transcription factor [Eubacteriales bacterium]